MSIFYSPTSKGNGAILNTSFSSKDGCGFFKLIKQTGWDPNSKKGSFQGGEIVNVKLSQDEIGAFIEAVRNKGQTTFYHSFDSDKTTGKFNYYYIEPQTPNSKAKEGFGLTINKNGTEFKVGFSLGAAERFMEFLKFALDHIFSAEYSAQKKQAEEYLKAKEDKEKAKTTAPKTTKPKGKAATKPEPEPENEEIPEGELEPEEEPVDF